MRVISFLWLTLAVLLNVVTMKVLATTESSGEYLQKVMSELQQLNSPSLLSVHDDSLPSNTGVKDTVFGNKNQVDLLNQIEIATRKKAQKNHNQIVEQYRIPPARPTNKIDLDHAPSEVQPQYYRRPQVQAPVITKMHEPEALGLTRAELAAMYKNALEKGSAISLSSLTNALTANTAPQVTENHLEVPGKQPMYQYYFFPLKTFASELTKTHGYKTIPDSVLENTQATEVNQTQMTNPLFVAISTFVSMALIFIMGVLFLPKLAQYGVIHAREIQDNAMDLSSFIMTVIDQYNLLEKYTRNRLRSNRRNRTNRGRRRKRRTVNCVG